MTCRTSQGVCSACLAITAILIFERLGLLGSAVRENTRRWCAAGQEGWAPLGLRRSPGREPLTSLQLGAFSAPGASWLPGRTAWPGWLAPFVRGNFTPGRPDSCFANWVQRVGQKSISYIALPCWPAGRPAVSLPRLSRCHGCLADPTGWRAHRLLHSSRPCPPPPFCPLVYFLFVVCVCC